MIPKSFTWSGRRTLVVLLAGACLWTATPAPAQAGGLDWEIASFDVEIQVKPDATLDVTERIVADFSNSPHHGIMRFIPYAYRREGVEYDIRIDVQSVTDDRGAPYRFSQSRSDGAIRLKIGDPQSTVSGLTPYRIRYTVKRALNGFDTYDELYWGATGERWPVPIAHASCTVTLPKPPAAAHIKTASFVGPTGSRAAGPPATITPDGKIVFSTPGELHSWTGLTIVVGFEKGLVAAPTQWTRFLWFLMDNSILLAPVVVFAALFALWRQFGRDLGEPGSIAVQYEPPDKLTPVEVGTVIDERVDTHDVTASIIDLAIRGYLRIIPPAEARGGGPTHLVRTDKPDSGLKAFEKRILSGLFAKGADVTLTSLETKFYPTLTEVQREVYSALGKNGYFVGNIQYRRIGYITLGVLAAAASLAGGFLLGALDVFAPISTIIAAVLTAILFPIFGYYMPRKTAQGRKALEHIKGLEEFIQRAELPELETSAQQAQFERLLPYAMALNLSRQWAQKFQNIYVEPPQWYAWNQPDFSTWWFVNELNRSTLTMNRSLSALPRTSSSGGSGWKWSSGGAGGGFSGFGGGGFSGGGFGGGGGNAW